MTDYVYGGILVADAVTFRRATNAACTVYDVNDLAETTPLALRDPSGVALPNPLTSSGDAFLPPLVTTAEGIKIKGGGLTIVVYSHAGMQAAAQEAATAAQEAASDAATAAGLAVAGASVNSAGELVIQQVSGTTLNAGPVKGGKGDKGDKGDKGTDGANVLPTDAAIAQALQDPNSQTRAAGNATYASAFAATQTIAYNTDGTVQSVTENGVTTTYTYNSDGTVASDTRTVNGVATTRNYGYTNGNLTSITKAA